MESKIILFFYFYGMFKRAFTLIEISIVVIISGVLFTLLAKAFITASELYIYEKNQKNVESDILFINQNLQNLADNSQIDYEKYSNLENTLGFTGYLFLKDENYHYKIFSKSGVVYINKFKTGENFLIPLNNTGLTYIENMKFKILPYKDPYKFYLDNSSQPFVQVNFVIKSKYYNPKSWEQNVRYLIQEGFNFKYYNN